MHRGEHIAARKDDTIEGNEGQEFLNFLRTLYIPHDPDHIPKDSREKGFLSDYQKRKPPDSIES
ncbi:MAG: hypothetical protein PHC90_14810, partial [Syntrophorhabdaceae bacterium]|nr:hypothetical protein [Syntrophorhabdaceae bacterium]